YGVIRPYHVGLLLLAALIGGWDVGPAVMGDLMAGLDHGLTLPRPGFDGEPRREPGGTDAARLQKRPDARRRPTAELAARQRRRRHQTARDEARHGVEIKGEADDVA